MIGGRMNGENGALLRTLEAHTKDVRSVAVSPDGATIMSSSSDETFRLWRATDGALLHIFQGHTYLGHLLRFPVAVSPDRVTIVRAALTTTRCGCGAWPTARCCAHSKDTPQVWPRWP